MIQSDSTQRIDTPLRCLDRAIVRRAEELLCRLIPNAMAPTLILREHLQTKEQYLQISLPPTNEESLLSETKLKMVAQALALQMGLRVELSSKLMGHSPSHSQSEEVQGNTSRIFSATSERTVFAVVLERPLVNVYEDLPIDILSRLVAKDLDRSTSPTQAPQNNSSLEGVRETLKELLGPNSSKVIDRGGFIQVALTEDAAILLEPDFYELTALLANKSPQGRSIVVTLLSPTQHAIATPEADTLTLPPPILQAQDETIDPRLARIEKDTCTVQEMLLASIGTKHPITVTYNGITDTIVVGVLTHNLRAAGLNDIVQKVQTCLEQSDISYSIQRVLVSGTSLFLNPGKREQVSIDDIEDMAGLTGKLLRLNTEHAWAEISVNGNCLEIEPKVPAPPLLRQAIREKLALIPAPIVIRQPSQSVYPLARGELVAMVKLMLPPSACLKGLHGDPNNNRLTLAIQCPHKEWDLLKPQLNAITKSVAHLHQQIIFKPKFIEQRVAEAFNSVSSRHRKVIARHMLPHGAISLTTWEPLERKPLINPSSIVERLQASNTQFKDWTHKPCFSVDPQRSSLIEDCLSVEVDTARDEVTIGVHLVCAPVMIHPFSVRRFKAYDRGDTVYTRSTIPQTSKMFPELDLLGFAEGAVRPAISVSFSVPRGSLHNPDIVAQSVASASIDFTFVANQRRLGYSSSLRNVDELHAPSELRQSLTLVDQVAASIMQSNALHRWRSIRGQESDFSHRLTAILRVASNAIAKEVSTAGLPCLYHLYNKPSEAQLKNMQELIKSNLPHTSPLALFAEMSPSNLLRDEALLFDFLAQVRALGPAFRDIKKCAVLSEVLSPELHQPGLLTILPTAVKNPPLRSLSALIAQHQLLASRGVLPPLSSGEVSVLLQRLQRQAEESDRVRQELELFDAFNTLRTAPAPYQARVRSKLFNALPKLELFIEPALPAPCLLNETPQTLERLGVSLQDGDTIEVTPLHYNLVRGCFIFQLADLGT